MALPYTSGDFTQARVVDHWVEYPFSDFGDTASKVYKLKLVVTAEDYATLETTANMGSAGSAGVIALPSGFTDVTARFCGDSAPASISGGLVEFVREFANVPLPHTDYSSALFTSAPTFGSRSEIIQYVPLSQDPFRVRRTQYERKASETNIVAARVEYSYTLVPTSVQLLEKESFEIVDEPVSYEQETFLGYSGVWVWDAGGKTVIPTGDTGVLEGTTIRKWKGPIFEVVTVYQA